MAENHFITRYSISESKTKDKLSGIKGLHNLFEKNLQDIFFNFLKNYFVGKNEIHQKVLEEKAKNFKNFFKIIELDKDSDGTIFGKIIFSDYEEVLNSLIVKDENYLIPREMTFIPQRTFFFMLKFIKIREVADKTMEIGILLLHKRGMHSIKSPFESMLSKIKKDVKLNINSITFKEEFDELEKAEIKEITLVERDTMSDFPEDECLDLGIKKSQRYVRFKIEKGRIGVTKYVKKFCDMLSKSNKAPFYLGVESNSLNVTLEGKNGKKVLTYTNENGTQRIASIILDNQKIYKNQELDWEAIKNEFKKEITECEKRMKVKNWSN